MNKEKIISEIRRTANANGKVPGWKRFRSETGIKYTDWCGKFWARWSDAVREAGFKPNRLTEAYRSEFLLEKLALLTRRLGHVPVGSELMLAVGEDTTFPNRDTFRRRLGQKPMRVSRMIAFCEANPEYNDVLKLWREAPISEETLSVIGADQSSSYGYVYLLQHGSRREYKIGRTLNPLRREGEVAIQLPEKLSPVHYIKTDDPSGIENYWHTRFAAKRKEGEWFALMAEDIRSFKRWKQVC